MRTATRTVGGPVGASGGIIVVVVVDGVSVLSLVASVEEVMVFVRVVKGNEEGLDVDDGVRFMMREKKGRGGDVVVVAG